MRKVTLEAVQLSAPRVTGIERYAFDAISTAASGHYRILLGGATTAYVTQLQDVATRRGWETQYTSMRSLVLGQLEAGLRAQLLPARGVHYFSLAPAPISVRSFSITLYDVGAWQNKRWMSRGMRYLYAPLIERAIRNRNLRGVITISEFSRDEIVRAFGLSRDMVHVVYPRTIGNLMEDAMLARTVKANHGKYYLHVGTIEPRKQVDLVVQAFQQARLQDVELLLAGRQGWGAPVAPMEGVRWLGQVSDETLMKLYSGAVAVISASPYEGFNLPVAEALSLGTVVFAQNIPVHRELYSRSANCHLFDTVDELIDMLRCPPLAVEANYHLPLGPTLDDVLVGMYA